MVAILDFTNAEGSVDWQAYREAQRAAGEVCERCGAYVLFPKVPGFSLCGACKHVDDNLSEAVFHERFIRCPYCRNLENISDWDCDYGREKYEEGEHTVVCSACEREYTIRTFVSYEYESPPCIQGEDGA